MTNYWEWCLLLRENALFCNSLQAAVQNGTSPAFLDTLYIFPYLRVKIKDDYTTNQIFTNFSVLYNDRINLFSFFSILILNLRAFNIKVCLLVESVPLTLPYRNTETVFSQEYSVMGPTPAHHRNKQTMVICGKGGVL